MVIWIMKKQILILTVILMIITITIAQIIGVLTGDKINRQTDSYNNSFLDRINKKLESLENIERSITVEIKKMIVFWTYLKKMKALNSEREFEPHHRSPLTKSMTDNWHDRQMNNFDRLINMTCRKNDERNDLKKE